MVKTNSTSRNSAGGPVAISDRHNRCRQCRVGAWARGWAISLIAKLGFDPVDAGPLRIARLLDADGMLWIDQALNRRRGQNFAFAITTRLGAA
jgi:hypothetical protein